MLYGQRSTLQVYPFTVTENDALSGEANLSEIVFDPF